MVYITKKSQPTQQDRYKRTANDPVRESVEPSSLLPVGFQFRDGWIACLFLRLAPGGKTESGMRGRKESKAGFEGCFLIGEELMSAEYCSLYR